MRITSRPLPTHCYSSRELQAVNGVVVHYFSAINVSPEAAFNLDTCYDLLLDLNAPGPERGLVMRADNTPRYYASYHYLIARDGEVVQLVPEDRRAHHAGRSEWRGRANLNEWTAGVALLASADSGFTDAQYASASHLCADLMMRHPIEIGNICGHDAVAIPRGRKKDPGKLFDWERLKAPLRGVERA